MKVVHVPFSFYPDPVGGTELYVQQLADEMQRRNIEALIATPGAPEDERMLGTLRVRRFERGACHDLRELYGGGSPAAARAFGQLLDSERPDVVHLHALTASVSLRVVGEAKRRGIPTVFTYHTPSTSCQRGTLLQWGRDTCDGVLMLGRCTRCTLQGLHLPRPVADVVGSTPRSAGRTLEMVGLTGDVWTALRMRELIDLRHRTFHALMTQIDHVVAVCTWVKELLLRNGVAPSKITVSRHGVQPPGDAPLPERSNVPAGPLPLRIAFLGRLAREKGLETLIHAVRSLPTEHIQLDVYGLPSEGDHTYGQQLARLAASDDRITMHLPVANHRVVALLRTYHVLAVPSHTLETGPFVVLEAFEAGIPVVGSNLGGIAELIDDGVNGLLVEVNSVQRWASALHRLARNRALLLQLQNGVRPPRRLHEVATEMEAVYQRLTRGTVSVGATTSLGNHGGGTSS